MKNWKVPNNLLKKKFDNSMKSERIVIKQEFDTLKNRWRILKNFESRLNRVARITIACCWL